MTRQTKAAAEVSSIIECVLELKKEQDALAEDIRGIYLEAHKRGWNKTSIGQAVSIIRKRDKDARAFDGVANDTAQYLQAYYGTGTMIAPHAHEDLPPHDPVTGEITEAPTATAASVEQPAPVKASALPAAEATAGGATVNPCGPAEIIREQGESGAPPLPDEDIPDFLRRGHPENKWAVEVDHAVPSHIREAGART